MKKYLLFFCILYFKTFSFCQKSYIVKFYLDDCRGVNNYYGLTNDTIFVYKTFEDSVFQKLYYNYKHNSFDSTNLIEGEYTIMYYNLFGMIIKQRINVLPNDNNSFTFCANQLDAYPNNVLAKLKSNDKIEIDYLSQGCFNHDTRKLCIKKEGKFITAYLYSTKHYDKYRFNVNSKLKIKSLIAKVPLDDKKINDFIKFENEILHTDDYGCTTTNYFIIKSRYWNLFKTDGNCDWDGFNVLLTSFFGDAILYIE
jgi:hypothetical protein